MGLHQPTVGLLYMLLHDTILLYMLLYIYMLLYVSVCYLIYILYEALWANQSLWGWQRVNMTQLGRPQAIEEEGWKGQTRPGQLDRISHVKSWTKRTNQYHSNGGYTYWNIRFLVGVNNTNTIFLVGVQPFFCCTPILQHARCCPPCFFFDLNPVVMVLAGFSRLVLLNSSYHQIHQMPSVFPTQMYQGWLASWMKRCTASQLRKPVENAPQRWAWPSGAWSSIYGHVL